MITELWKKEADYQLAEAILRSWLDANVITEQEFKASLMHIKEAINPPFSGLN